MKTYYIIDATFKSKSDSQIHKILFKKIQSTKTHLVYEDSSNVTTVERDGKLVTIIYFHSLKTLMKKVNELYDHLIIKSRDELTPECKQAFIEQRLEICKDNPEFLI